MKRTFTTVREMRKNNVEHREWCQLPGVHRDCSRRLSTCSDASPDVLSTTEPAPYCHLSLCEKKQTTNFYSI